MPRGTPRTYNVGVVGGEQALLVCVVEVAAVRNGRFFARVPGVVLLQRQCVRECIDCIGDEYAQDPARAARCLPYREHGRMSEILDQLTKVAVKVNDAVQAHSGSVKSGTRAVRGAYLTGP